VGGGWETPQMYNNVISKLNQTHQIRTCSFNFQAVPS
jgi:hypothetical protein